MRRAARIDDNHRAIVAVLRGYGAVVESLAAVGHGMPDLLVGVGGRNHLVEVKDGKKWPSHRRLTSDQVAFHAMWATRGGAPIVLLSSVADAETWVKHQIATPA